MKYTVHGKKIKVTDDLKKYVEEKLKKLDETHVGIKNARERLEMMCDGEVTIESELNKGTRVTIKLPQK